MARVIAICNAKGGVGKTSTAVNLGAYLAAAGKRTLLIDFDPQANASSALGYNPMQTEVSVYHGVIGAAEHEAIVKPTVLYNLQLVPSAPHLAGALIEFVDMPEREYFLRKYVNRIRHHYDYILIDLPPSLSLLTVNGLVAADEVLIPVQAEYYSLEGIGQLLDTVQLIRDNLQHPLGVAGAVVTMFDKREHLSREVARNLRANFPHHVFDVEIPRSVAIAEAPSFSQPVLLYRPDAPGAIGYRRLAAEVIEQEKNFMMPPDSSSRAIVSENFGELNIL